LNFYNIKFLFLGHQTNAKQVLNLRKHKLKNAYNAVFYRLRIGRVTASKYIILHVLYIKLRTRGNHVIFLLLSSFIGWESVVWPLANIIHHTSYRTRGDHVIFLLLSSFICWESAVWPLANIIHHTSYRTRGDHVIFLLLSSFIGWENEV
jgi:hypothetical protein